MPNFKLAFTENLKLEYNNYINLNYLRSISQDENIYSNVKNENEKLNKCDLIQS